jgi:hypothetical protein
MYDTVLKDRAASIFRVEWNFEVDIDKVQGVQYGLSVSSIVQWFDTHAALESVLQSA